MKRVTWSAAAVADVQRVRDYLDSRGSDGTQATIDHLVLASDWLLAHPAVGSIVGHRGWRKWRPRQTAFLLSYKPTRAGLTIVHVVHVRSDWQSLR